MRRNIDAIEAQSLSAQRDTFKRLQNVQILRMADDLERDADTEGFKHVIHLLSEWLKHKEKAYEAIKDASVREIMAGTNEYLMSRLALEVEIRQLKSILNIPTSYRAKAKAILETPTTETYRRKIKIAKEKQNG